MKCPGQDPRFWKFDAIFEAECPKCGTKVEFFKDETRRRCKNCGGYVLNPKMDFGCAAHCKFAEQCFGDLPPELIKQKEDLLKDRVAVEMKVFLKNDFKRIGHAAKVASFVEMLTKEEKGDPAITMSATYLSEIVDSYNANPNGKPVMKLIQEILDKVNAPEPLANSVIQILEGNCDDSLNCKLLEDAQRLTEIQQEIKKLGASEKRDAYLKSGFHTKTAEKLARDMHPM